MSSHNIRNRDQSGFIRFLEVHARALLSEPLEVLLRAEDKYGNICTDFEGKIKFKNRKGIKNLPNSIQFSKKHKGIYNLNRVVFPGAGFWRIEAYDSMYELDVISNASICLEEKPKYYIYWGDIHGHSEISDGQGSIEEYFQYARDFAGLDFAACTDHDFLTTNEEWALIKKVVKKYHEPYIFTTILGYEWSAETDSGGDHNVYYLKDDLPIFRSDNYYNKKNPEMFLDPNTSATHITELWEKLLSTSNPNELLTIPHHGGRPANPQWHNEDLDRLCEIYSEYGRFHQWIHEFLSRGYRLALIGSSDDHYGNPGDGYLSGKEDKQNRGLVAILAEELTRNDIFSAMRERRCYATTGERILLNFKINNSYMGETINVDEELKIVVEAVGTTTISYFEIIKNSEILHSQSNYIDVINWTETYPKPEESSYYFARVIQEDGEEACSSPIWIDIE